VVRDKKSKSDLLEHLLTLKRQYKRNYNIIIIINDRDNIGGGSEWRQEIEDYLSRAHIILLLVSRGFLNSEFCIEVELTQAIARHHAKKARVIPIILEHCLWHNEEFSVLKPLPENGKPVNKWDPRNDAFFNIALGIEQAIKDLAGISEAK
jgi:hypothetical protein